MYRLGLLIFINNVKHFILVDFDIFFLVNEPILNHKCMCTSFLALYSMIGMNLQKQKQ
jgi:hypothetical protein